MSSDDDDSDSSMDLGSEDRLDINSILNSDDGESDSDNNDLADLGLLSELLNEEVTDKWKKKKSGSGNSLIFINCIMARMIHM